MDAPPDEAVFLRDLVKATRQRPHAVTWIDRDGTERVTTLTAAEAARLNAIARRDGLSQAEVLRRAAHVPVAR